MVFHYVNFVQETNTWWLRRVRPVWMGVVALGGLAVFYRYYYYHRIQAQYARSLPEEIQKEQAELNKRPWGYGRWFEPTLEKSRKRRLYDELGANYKHAKDWENMAMDDQRTAEEIYREETDEFEL